MGGIGEKNSNKDTQWYIQNRIYDSDGLCPALTTYKSDYWVCVKYEENYQAQKVYMVDGLATTLSANGGTRRQDWFVFGE